MATSTGPNLEPARRAVEKLMDDTCRITSDRQGSGDDALDQETGQIVRPADDDEPVYEGKALFSAISGTGRNGGQAFAIVNYNLAIPLSAPELTRGMRVEWTSARRDGRAVGEVFYVEYPIYKTMAASRRAQLSREAVV
jgi:hypothetical protein